MAAKLITKALILLFSLASLIMLSNCSKEEPKLNIILRNKSLDTIKHYVQGMWHLRKVTGGICSTCGSPVTENPYMNIANERILIGNDTGKKVDTIIVWKKTGYGMDSTYLLTYRTYKYYAFPINYVVDRIENNNLILMDYASDPFYYQYAK